MYLCMYTHMYRHGITCMCHDREVPLYSGIMINISWSLLLLVTGKTSCRVHSLDHSNYMRGCLWDAFSFSVLCHPSGLNVTTALTTPQRQLVKAGMAEPNPDHLINLSNNLGLPLVSVEPISIDDPHIRWFRWVCMYYVYTVHVYVLITDFFLLVLPVLYVVVV